MGVIRGSAEALANPGSIWIVDSAYRQTEGKVPVNVADLGEQQLKNIARPVRVCNFGWARRRYREQLLPRRTNRLLPFCPSPTCQSRIRNIFLTASPKTLSPIFPRSLDR